MLAYKLYNLILIAEHSIPLISSKFSGTISHANYSHTISTVERPISAI